ncbi:hypothetical protein CS0771_42130 [Catellatospora sp. IY07-71]|uniref:effector-associated constant component EACC1 n=1 Tax=Catellatospora sp. IY07-71 TaxID=2728827 RepID=UPI001BB3C370|nr:hypothetical protein [Catellatospora sp. IY07-71]BCJ74669.1 hypothetical protein CS0771_42130 [Catellatospora sp. IY07-71]
MEVRMTVDGPTENLLILRDWLQNEPELRGRVAVADLPSAEGTMGVTAELVIQAAAVVVSGGTLWLALSRSLASWLTQRRSDVTVKVTTSDGREVAVDAKRVADPERLLREVLGVTVQSPQSLPEK